MNDEDVSRGLQEYASTIHADDDVSVLSSALSLPVFLPSGEKKTLATLLPPPSTSILVLGRNLL